MHPKIAPFRYVTFSATKNNAIENSQMSGYHLKAYLSIHLKVELQFYDCKFLNQETPSTIIPSWVKMNDVFFVL